MTSADWLSICILQHVNKHSAVTSTMAGVNSKMDHELIEDKDIEVVDAYASCRGCNIPRSGLQSDNELCSSCDNNQRCINCCRYLGLHLYADIEERWHACVRKSSQIGSGVEKSIWKSPRRDRRRTYCNLVATIKSMLRISFNIQKTRLNLHWKLLWKCMCKYRM